MTIPPAPFQPPPPRPGEYWAPPPVSPEDRERHLLVTKANRIGMEILILLVFTPYGFYLFFKALRLRKELRALHEPVPGATSAAIGCGALSALYIILAIVGVFVAVFLTSMRSPEVWVASGQSEPARLTIDGQEMGQVAFGSPRRFELETGSHRLCFYSTDSGEPLCTSRELERREVLLWNPESLGRFVQIVSRYATSPSDAIDDQVTFLPRAEWHRIGGLDHFFEEPPEQVYTSGSRETRDWIMQASSFPVLVFVDNGLRHPVELVEDGEVVASVEANHWTSIRVREGSRHLAVRNGATLLVETTATLQDFGTYVLDCERGMTSYVERTVDQDNRVVAVRPVAPAPLHDISDFDSVFSQPTARAAWLPPPRGQRRLFALPQPR